MERETKAFRFGVIGTGKIAGQFAEAARAAGCTVTSVLSRAADRGAAFAAGIGGGVRVCTEMEEFLASRAFDAVYVASPNSCHAQQAGRAIAAGYHVLLEKPATESEASARALFDAARAGGLVLLEAMRPLHDPLLALLRKTLPLLGTLRRAHLEYCQYSSRYDAFLRGEVLNAFDPRLANAAVMDIGVYAVAVMVALFGMPERVHSSSLFLENGFEGAGMALCEYCPRGMQVMLSYSKIVDSATPTVITGERGSILVDKLSGTKRVTLHLRGDAPRTLDYRPAENNMVYEIEDFVKMTKGERSPAEFEKFTLMTMTLLDTIRRQNNVRFDV